MQLGTQAADRFNEFRSRDHLVQACLDSGESFPCLGGKFFELCGSRDHPSSIIRSLPSRKRRATEKHDNAQRPVIIAKLSKLKGCHRV